MPSINWGYFQLLHSQPENKVDQSYKVRKIIIHMDTNSVSFIVSRMEEINDILNALTGLGKKKHEFKLSFGQATLSFFLPRANPYLSLQLMIFLQGELLGPLPNK